MTMDSPDENNLGAGGKSVSLKETKRTRTSTQSPYFLNSGANICNKTDSIKINSFVEIHNTKNTARLGDLFFQQPCITLAKELLGKILVRKLPTGQLLKGIIVETESYLGLTDKASHSFNGKRTERNEAMYLRAGTAYVYTIYGMYHCFNISSLEDGSAVLIRALEPLEGDLMMKELRSKRKKAGEIKTKELCNGPSKLCQALKIDKDLNKVNLCSSAIFWLEEGVDVDFSCIISCKRIGIDSCGEEWANKPFRSYLKNNCFVSRRNKLAEVAHAEMIVEKPVKC